MFNKDKFICLSPPESLRKRVQWVDAEMNLEQVICPKYEGHMSGGRRLTNLSVELPKLPVDDFVWTWYSECLIQDRVLKLFRQNGVTGFDVKPVKARFKGRTTTVPPKLWELVVTGWAGMAPPESGIKLKYSCDACALKEYSCFTNPGALINESAWDGSDMFIVWPMPAFIFITHSVMQIIIKNRLKGASMVPIVHLKCENSLSPGKLSYHMPENLARKYGGPLGIY